MTVLENNSNFQKVRRAVEHFFRNIGNNHLSADSTKWSTKLKQFVGKHPTNCLSVFDHFMGSALKAIRSRF